ncbi:transferrin-binding protein 1 [Neisseria gonorrhoeae]|uniref:Transferrin-binding protein 1 n=1 Tax=Neisseria gonorrhoeae TaxID=485 RepID=A0A378VT10_NEIGO|nr:transferrin-binding protein 1 [Neisseria gonorrhoeae]
MVTGQICLFGNNTYTDCTPRSINGKSYYAAVRDNVRLGRWADVGAGLRYDYRSTHSDDGSVSTGTHRTLSWNAGIVLKPADWLDLTYRTSTGFRLPSFAEMYGWRSGDKIKAVKIDPEKSFNKEAGIVFKGDFGNLEASWFDNAYRDLIVRGYEVQIKDGKEQAKGNPAYLNAQSARITGINIWAKSIGTAYGINCPKVGIPHLPIIVSVSATSKNAQTAPIFNHTCLMPSNPRAMSSARAMTNRKANGA